MLSRLLGMLMLKAYKYFCKEILLSWDELDELGEGDLGEAVFGVGRSVKPRRRVRRSLP